MDEARWKLVVDRQGVTIENDRFQLTTNGSRPAQLDRVLDDAFFEGELLVAESSQMESIVGELQTMTRREYGQFCGLSRALEIVGERWALLIVRDLLVGPKRLDDMHKGLPRMPQDILAARLKELERSGIVRRHGPSPSNGSDSDELGEPDGSTVFELTESGSELEDAVLKLALWGTRLLDKPRPKDIVTPDSLVMALRTTFRPEAAVGVRVSYELRFGPEMIIHARIDDGAIEAAEGPLPDADLVIEPGPMLKALMAREVTPAEVLEDGSVSLTGDPNLFNRFVDLFYIPPAPAARKS